MPWPLRQRESGLSFSFSLGYHQQRKPRPQRSASPTAISLPGRNGSANALTAVSHCSGRRAGKGF